VRLKATDGARLFRCCDIDIDIDIAIVAWPLRPVWA
jgi:hypothetical protein